MTDPVAARIDGHATQGTDAPALPVGWSLRTRLALLLALAIVLVVGVTTYLQSRLFERTVEQELADATRLVALAVADDLELREGPFTAAELEASLRQFVETLPELGSITVVTLDGWEARGVREHGHHALGLRAERRRGGHRRAGPRVEQHQHAGPRAGGPVDRARARPFGAVAVTVSFDALFRLRNTGRVIAAWSTCSSPSSRSSCSSSC